VRYRQVTYQNGGTYAIYASNEEKKRQDFNCFIIGDKHSACVVLSLRHERPY